MRLIISFTALFVSIFFVQLGSGTLAPLDALAGLAREFSTVEIGWLGSAHFIGFFVGCFVAPRLIGSVGHSRAFAVGAAFGAVGALLHPVFGSATAWAVLRLFSGLAVAVSYTAVESWLQAKVTRESRGRVFGIYRIVDLCGALGAQGLIAVLPPAEYVSYNLVSAFCCLSLLPLALTRRAPPPTPTTPRLDPLKTMAIAPTAVAGIVVSGITGPAFRMVGPVVAEQNGLDPGEIAMFLAAAVFGGAAAQFPVGMIADRIDRRWLLVWISLWAVIVSAGTGLLLGHGDVTGYYIASFLFGTSAFTIYSVAAAYANDRSPAEFIVDLNASLLFFFSVGAIASPLLTAALIEAFGPNAMFFMVAAAHSVLIVFSLWRMTRRPAAGPSVPYHYLPRTSMTLTRLLGGRHGGARRDDPEGVDDAPPPRGDGDQGQR